MFLIELTVVDCIVKKDFDCEIVRVGLNEPLYGALDSPRMFSRSLMRMMRSQQKQDKDITITTNKLSMV